MRIATASAIAAFVLSIAASNAMAVNSGNSTNGPTAGALGIDMSQVGTDAPSMKKYFSGLTPTEQAATMNHCNEPVTMTDTEKLFCQSIK